MPTVLIEGPYRFFFYSGDGDEPVHIHIERDDKAAKFWLDPVMFKSSGGFTRKDINQIQKIIEKHQTHLRNSWNEYFRG